jgi:FKBP-type peptidyl-prolyl cis-trans isomerase FkpA
MRIVFASILLFWMGTLAAQNTIPAGFAKKGNGCLVKVLRDKPGTNAKVGDYVAFRVVMTDVKGDTLVKNLDQAMAIVQTSSFKGSLDDVLVLMSPGDSLQALISVDSLFEKVIQQPIPANLTAGTFFTYNIVVDIITDRAGAEAMAAKKVDMQKQKDEVIIQQYLKDKKLEGSRSESGLYIVWQKRNTEGAPAMKGKHVHVHYTGYLTNGQKFDSSVDRGQPFEFGLGSGQVIAGWDEGIAALRVGEKALLLIPSYMGYGPRGSGSIPANAVLVFEVELMDVH